MLLRSRRQARASAADVQRDVTVLVKTFERPDCLTRLVASIRRFYPRILIFVVDDSREPFEPLPDGVMRYWHLPYRSLGSGPGRNFGLRHVETEYVLVCDDDMVFGRKTDLRRMLRALETTPFDIVSCMWMDHDPWKGIRKGFNRWEGTLEIVDRTLVHHFDEARDEVGGLPVFDVVHQFFMARVERLGEDPWEPAIKVRDHDECFLRLRDRGLRSTRLSDVVVYHHPELPPSYQSVRENTAESLEIWKRIRGIDRLEFRGRLFRRSDRLRYQLPSTVAYTARRVKRVGTRLLREGKLRA